MNKLLIGLTFLSVLFLSSLAELWELNRCTSKTCSNGKPQPSAAIADSQEVALIVLPLKKLYKSALTGIICSINDGFIYSPKGFGIGRSIFTKI
jgi:hypothetical protein